MGSSKSPDERTLTLNLGRDEIVIRGIYEVVSIINDIMIAGWFIAGSILFFREETTTLGTWFFLVGSVQLLIRPTIRLARRVHLKRLRMPVPSDSSHDF